MLTETCLFNCLGEDNLKDSKLGNSFLKNDMIKYLFQSCTVPNFIVLNGITYNSDEVLLSSQRDLFCFCRKKFMIISKSATKTDTRVYGVPCAELSFKNYGQLRKRICEFVNVINFYLAKSYDEDFNAISSEVLSSLQQRFSSLWKLVAQHLDYVIHPNNSVTCKSSPAAFHFFHLLLDFLWYRLMILYRIQQLTSSNDLQDVSWNACEDVSQYVQYLLKILFSQALSRFEKLPTHEVKRKSPFLCTCVKELWLLLQIFMDKNHHLSNQSEFWTEVNSLCIKLCVPTSEGQENIFGVLKSSNPLLFSLWLLFHLGQLYSYSERGEFIGPSSSRMVANYPLLEKILKLLLSADIISEAQLRLCIPFIADLVVNLWPSQRDPVCKLWEHFHHRLNGCFYLQGTSPGSIAISCSTGADMLMQIFHIVDPSLKPNHSFCPENSFHLFLRFLGLYLRQNPSQWCSIKGRIFSKFSQTKMQALKEIGIYNFSTLFLSLAVAGPVKEVGDKMQELLCEVLNPSLDFNRRLVIWKAHLGLLQLYIEREMDIAGASKILMEDVNYVSNFKNRDTSSLFNVLSRGFRDIVIASKSLNFSEYSLIGNWIHSYLKLTPESSLLIDTLSEIMTKILAISRSVGMIEYNAPESHLTKLFCAMCKYLLPYIKEKFASFDQEGSYYKVADLAVNISLLALNRTYVGVSGTSVPHLFESFAVNANPLNAKLSIRYVCILLQEEGILSELMDSYSDYDVLIIQTWLRCSVYIFEEDLCDELMKLTQIICEIPSFHSLCQEVSKEFEWHTKPVESFLEMIQILYERKKSLQDKSEFREKCVLYMTPMVKSFERTLRYKEVSERTLLRIYEVTAFLIQNCGSVIYSKSQPQCIFNILVSSLLLPVSFFKPGVEIPRPILSAVQKTFPEIIHGLVHLNSINGNSLFPTIKNIVVKYFPRLVGKSSTHFPESGKSFSLPGHPLILCFADKTEVPKHIMEIISHSFIKVGEAQCMNALMFLLEVLRDKKFSEEMVNIIIDISLSQVLEVIILSDARMFVMKRNALHLVKELLANKINGSPTLSTRFWTVLFTLVQKHIVLHTVNVMALLCKMCDMAPDMVLNKFQDIKEIMVSPSVFHRSNVSKTVRTGIENMEKLLKLSKTNC